MSPETLSGRHNFLPFCVIPGLNRNPVTSPFYHVKIRNYKLLPQKIEVAGYRLEFTPYLIRGRYDLISK